MVNEYSKNGAGALNGVKIASSVNGIDHGDLDKYMQKKETRPPN